jgi:hypothetical protein
MRENELSHESTTHSDEIEELEEIGESTMKHRPSNSIDSTNTQASSETSFDAAWVGGLPREELEKLLFESRQIIKDRERDLGIAATIGQALLEKNISLRNRHEGILSRFSSLNNLSALQAAAEEDHHVEMDPNTSLPHYTPPQSDGETGAQLSSHTCMDQITPRPQYQQDTEHLIDGEAKSYFPQEQSSPLAPRTSHIKPMTTIGGGHAEYDSECKEQQPWDSPSRKSHYVRSNPVSPGDGLSDIGQHSFQPSDTHRRLELISMQNDELLDQIAQLQHESEKAKREGGKRQKKLIREIDGLRAELDAAESRNTELERSAAEQRNSDEQENDESVQRKAKRKIWRRRGTLPWKALANDHGRNSGEDLSAQQSPGAAGISQDRDLDRETTEDCRATSQYARSESEQSAASRHTPQTEAERAIVAQLMAKVRELEEINSALIEDAHERDGRIGRFVEDSERLRDLYDAAESEVNESFSAAASMQDLRYVSSQHRQTPFSTYSISPASISRRAAGNRYLIEGRRTIRAAMRPERSPDSVEPSKQLNVDDVRFDSSAENSPNSALGDVSPARARESLRAMRPRILLTPSCEDLQAQAELDRQRAASAAASAHLAVGSANRLHLHGTRSDVSLRERYICEDSSEEEDVDNSFDTRSVRRTLRHRSSEGNFSRLGGGGRSPPVSRRTLSCELSEEAVSHQLPSPPLSPRSKTAAHGMHLRSASQLSLTALSDGGSDIADVQWSAMSVSVSNQSLVDERMMIPYADSSRALTVQDQHFDRDNDLIQDGLWYASAAQEIVPRGALRDDIATSHEHYVQLEKMSTNLPVHWADDEDFGKPITERDARRYGLMDERGNDTGRASKGRSLLSWIKPKGFETPNKGKGRESNTVTSTSMQIESVEDAARRHELEHLLRAKRNAALHDRVVNGQITLDDARRRGAYDYDEDYAKYSGLANYSFEAEVTKRAFAYRSIKASSPRDRSNSRSPGRVRRQSSAAHGGTTTGEDKEEKEYYAALTLRQRYKPAVVKRRITRISSETITWALAWATFSVVMVLAFVSAFARGPKRLLYGQAQRP